MLAHLDEQRGDRNKAIQVLEAASARQPGATWLLGELAGLYERDGNPQKAADLRLKADPGQALVGHAAPDFTLKDLSGKEMSVADLKGKVAFLNFWASW